MPTTLLAIDDSVTMRKVLELTFAGEDYRVVTADSPDTALAKLRSERPAVVVCDVSLDGAGGYGLCAKIKTENPGVPVVLLASKQQPYDSQKGLTARADDFIEKPFDTQQLIDKVKRLAGRPVAAEAASMARPAGPGGTTQPGAPPFGGPAAIRPMSPAVPVSGARPGSGLPAGGVPLNPRPTAPGMGGAAQQAVGRGTLAYGGLPGSPPLPGGPGAGVPSGPPVRPAMPPAVSPPAVPPAPVVQAVPVPAPRAPAPAAPAPAPVVQASAPAARAPAPPAPVAPAAPPGSSAAAAAIPTNGQLAQKLAHLGLSEVQLSAVIALSREVVEQVVWEVVPVLAETLIKEEIKRLTSE